MMVFQAYKEAANQKDNAGVSIDKRCGGISPRSHFLRHTHLSPLCRFRRVTTALLIVQQARTVEAAHFGKTPHGHLLQQACSGNERQQWQSSSPCLSKAASDDRVGELPCALPQHHFRNTTAHNAPYAGTRCSLGLCGLRSVSKGAGGG